MIGNTGHGGKGGVLPCTVDRSPLEAFINPALCGIKLGHDLVQGGVHRVLGGKLRHGIHQPPYA